VKPSAGTRPRRIFAVTEARFAAAAVTCLVLVLVTQWPAAELTSRSRLSNSAFVAGSDAQRIEIARSSDMMYLPRKEWLYFASIGNAPLAADAVWIRSAGYVTREFSTKYKGKKFEWLNKLYNTVFDLDPQWEQSAYISAMLLSAVRRDSSGAVDLLYRSMLRNPDSWRLPYQAGVTCLLWPGHSEEAVKYFLEAVRRPGHPEIIEDTIPRLMSEAGRLEQAILHARSRLYVGGMPAFSRGTLVQLGELVAEQLQEDLQAAVRAFTTDHGRPPADVAEMRATGRYLAGFDIHYAQEGSLFGAWNATLAQIIARGAPNAPSPPAPELVAAAVNAAVLKGTLPPPESSDPYGLPFKYHVPTGTVRSEGLGMIEAKRTALILQGAVNYNYRNAGKKWAASLADLARWFAETIANGRTFPQDWTKRLGSGTPPEHPFAAWGESYAYDPATGRATVADRYDEVPIPLKVKELWPEE
jgi:hypothetical protein